MKSQKSVTQPSASSSTSSSSSSSSAPVPTSCYTCRRRHVRCDGAKPTCRKCVKGKVECLGYQKPLKWVGGASARGRKGRGTLIVTEYQSRDHGGSPKKESEYFGLHKSPNPYTDVAPSLSTFLEIVRYYNAIAQTENTSPVSLINSQMISLSSSNIKTIPKVILNILMAVSSIHLSANHSSVTEFRRLALETKDGAYRAFNTMLKERDGRATDLTFCCTLLIFAADILENGLQNYRLHSHGAAQTIISMGGILPALREYPYLRLPLFHFSQFETYSVACSHFALLAPKVTTRAGLENLLAALGPNSRVSNPCPRDLTRALWELGATAAGVLGVRPVFESEDLGREEILEMVLSFKPVEYVEELQVEYIELRKPENGQLCLLVTMAWKNALIILVLRYLFFDPHEKLSEKVNHPSPQQFKAEEPPAEPPSPDLYEDRHHLHNTAFNSLVSNLSLYPTGAIACNIRFILIPIIILSLVTTPSSPERALCCFLFAEFRRYFALHNSAEAEAGDGLQVEIPWQRLDEFSARTTAAARVRREEGRAELTCGAPEWNWWDMLRGVELDLAWPCTAGISHLERGIDFWALKLISSVVSEESFDTWAGSGKVR